jgi:hypothetical protein
MVCGGANRGVHGVLQLISSWHFGRMWAISQSKATKERFDEMKTLLT